MLQGEIKLYEPPALPTYVTYTSSSNSYSSMSEGEKERFREKFANALEDAQMFLSVGDIVTLSANPKIKLEILSFIEKPEDTMWYQGELCVVKARNIEQKGSGISYSLKELSLIPQQEVQANG